MEERTRIGSFWMVHFDGVAHSEGKGDPKEWNIGMMEHWNDGKTKKWNSGITE